jgi:hypothetical protein
MGWTSRLDWPRDFLGRWSVFIVSKFSAFARRRMPTGG